MTENESIKLLVDSLKNHCIKTIEISAPLINKDIEVRWVLQNLINELYKYEGLLDDDNLEEW